MPHFFVDDAFSDSKEVMAIAPRHRLPAVGLWTLCGSWSANKLTDGWIPNEVLKRLGATPAVVSALINDAGLFEPGTNGVQMTNWPRWQRTRDAVKAYRAVQAEKKRRQREHSKTHTSSDDSEMSPGDNMGDKKSCPPGTPQTPIPEPKPKYSSGNQSSSVTSVAVADDAVSATPGAELVRRIIPSEQPDSVKTALRIRASELVRNGHPSADVAAALQLWLTKPHLGPHALPTLLSEVLRSRNGNHTTTGIGKPTQKALGWQESAERIIAQMGDQP